MRMSTPAVVAEVPVANRYQKGDRLICGICGMAWEFQREIRVDMIQCDRDQGGCGSIIMVPKRQLLDDMVPVGRNTPDDSSVSD